MGALEDWIVPAAVTVLQITTSGAFLALGLLCLIFALRPGELSVIAPFRYSGVLWGFLFGWLIWGDRIDLPMLGGALIILVSGSYVTYRERVLPVPERQLEDLGCNSQTKTVAGQKTNRDGFSR